MTIEPFVSVVTPVYNGEAFLSECIESIVEQDYSNWEYIIVNNCSQDRTLEIADRYARQDRRIRVVSNRVFVNVGENHNNAFRQISRRSRYCKVVSADDRLLDHSLGKMVRFAADHLSVGIVGSYQRSNEAVKWRGLSEEVNILPGREACRMGLLQGIHMFGNPTSLLYRSDLIRRTNSFFPHSGAHADTSACYANLHDCDFGFIHEILSVERVHQGQVTKSIERLNAGDLAYIETLIRYGPKYLSIAELESKREESLVDYYRLLGGCVLKMKGRRFWQFHRAGLHDIGLVLDRRRILIEALRELGTELRNPLTALRKLRPAFENRH